MRELFEIDLKDYNANACVYRRPSVRGIIINEDNKIALVYSQKEHYYKFPGGGINEEEDMICALVREVNEEVGLVVKPQSITEFGSVLRRQKSTSTVNTIFEQENYYYVCEVESQIGTQELDDYEAEAGFVLRVVDLNDAIKVNEEYRTDDYFNEIMIKRELEVLKMVQRELLNFR